MVGIPRAMGLAVLSATAASVVAVEVVLTRLLSVTTWYGLAFLVLSLAMLGTTSGALWAARAREAGEGLRAYVTKMLVLLSASVVALAVMVLSTPLDFALDARSFGALLLTAGFATAPMAFGGAVIARLMAELDVPLSALYALDLVGAALGALLPLALLAGLSGPSALVVLAAPAAALALVLATTTRWRVFALVAFSVPGVLAQLTERTTYGLTLAYTKGARRHVVKAPFEAWNAISHVSLTPYVLRGFPLWSPGTKFKAVPHSVATAVVDGEAGTELYAYETLDQLEALKFDATTIAHALRSSGQACVIGVGGGRDIAAALLYGHDHVLGIEINPAMVKLLRGAERTPILHDARVEVVVGDGRAELARRKPSCTVLQAALVDTWAATSVGAFAHTESTIYTLEAWAGFLRRVEPDGIVTFSRWYEPTLPSETSRLVALGVAALLDRGARAPREHIALVGAGPVATLLVSPAPLTARDRAALARVSEERGFAVLAAPDQRATDPLLDALLDAPRVEALAEVGRPRGLDTSAATDDRPFFFQLLAANAWLTPSVFLKHVNHRGAITGNVAAAFQLVLTFFVVMLVASALLGPTLVRAAKDARSPLPGKRAATYFGALGAGFMLSEIALVQRMHVVLGHPTYSLVVVLCGLLVATGVGSAVSPRVLREPAHVRVGALGAALLLAALPRGVIGPLARATLESTFAVRALWTGATACLVGLVLGMLFPAGLACLERGRATPVALAVNGATGVAGGVLAVMISVTFGISGTFLLAAALYGVAAACAPPWGDLRLATRAAGAA